MGETTENCYALDPAWADPTLRQPLLHTTNSIKYTKVSNAEKTSCMVTNEKLSEAIQLPPSGRRRMKRGLSFDYDEVGN